MSIKDNTRWRSNGISCDHRPGLGRNSVGAAAIFDEPDYEPDNVIPFAVQQAILTGNGFDWTLPPADPCGYPLRVYYTPEEMAAEESPPTRKTCLTPYCVNTMNVASTHDYCSTCVKKRAAKKVQLHYSKSKPAEVASV